MLNGLLDRPGAYSPDWFRKTRRIPADSVLPRHVALVWLPSKGRYAHTIACVEAVTRPACRVISISTLEGNANLQGILQGTNLPGERARPIR